MEKMLLLSEKLADHALVLMFRPYRARWVQSIGVYATSGAASSSMLQKLVIRALQPFTQLMLLFRMLLVKANKRIRVYMVCLE